MELVWHRTELRTHDNPALHAALERLKDSGKRGGLVPLVIIDPMIFRRADLTPRRQAWFLENVRCLREAYRALGCDLVVRQGEPARVLAEFAQELKTLAKDGRHALRGAHFIRNYTPYAKERDAAATQVLQKHGVEVFSYGGQYTHEPSEVRKDDGTRYTVFAPFRKRWGTLPVPALLPAPRTLPSLPSTLRVGDIPHVQSDIELPAPGEAAALKRLEWFIENAEADYQKTRSRPDWENKTSKLSYYFNIGVLSPRLAMSRAETYRWKFELTWWDFFADLMDAHPQSAHEEAVAAWRGFPWRRDQAQLERWAQGQTGFPLVDAGLRELRATGFMHNRVRMVTADFLSRHLMIDWRQGEEIFRGLLLCGDRAQNVGNWQWVAGCGHSAKAYFRVGNPVSLSHTADPDGDYIRRWVKELRDVPPAHIHEPWTTERLPDGYPERMIDLKTTRARYLETAKAHLAQAKK